MSRSSRVTTRHNSFVPTAHNDTYPLISPAADLRGKSVFITGASRGIGRGPGARGSGIAVAARTGAAAAAKDVEAAFGGVLDVLINNASRSSAIVPLTETQPNDCPTRTAIIVSSVGAHLLAVHPGDVWTDIAAAAGVDEDLLYLFGDTAALAATR
ncbi:hypothetical protein F4825DRAFT_446910 [Nemania diffusa]|nr:hypothetical protein F4825DRAFT_446910 [Nemania diffusa]